MKRHAVTWLGLLVIALLAAGSETAWGRGGRGGGGGGGGGFRGGGGGGGFGGGGARPSGGFSGGGARPAGGYGGGARPSVGSSPSFSRPSAPVSRPSTPSARPSLPSGGVGPRPGGGNIGGGNIGTGSRPGLQPGSRPSIGTGGIGTGGSSLGARPSQLPSTRPSTGIGSGAGIGSGTGIGAGSGTRPGSGAGLANRPGTGQGITNLPGAGAGIATRPSQLPARLPGLGDGGLGSQLPNQGARVQDRMSNLSVADRRANLSDRMSNGGENWQNHRQDPQNDRQDWRDQNREDWQNWADDKHDHYGDWYHGGWYAGAGWGYMWDNYPVAAALGMTGWAVNRIGYGWGYYDYANPYYSAGAGYGYNYSEPLVVYADSSATATADPTAASTSQLQPTDEGLAAFEEARTAFHGGDYAGALAKLDVTLKTMPRDPVVHEFRSLVLFALQKYPESSAAIYAVLSAGPGWDWTTMISLYPGINPYTIQLRALEEFVKANPKSPDGHFLLGYHYQTMNHAPSAAKQFGEALALLPDDKLLKQLVAMAKPVPEPSNSAPPQPPAVTSSEKSWKSEQLVGRWKASSQGKNFELDLGQDGSFTWTYQRGSQKQAVTGVFALDQQNLALETNDGGGTMLAQVDLASPTRLKFKMVGDDPKDPGLEFQKN